MAHWLSQPLRQDTIDAMMEGLDEYEARSPAQVCAVVGGVHRTCYVKLARMYEAGLVTREPMPMSNGGGREYVYRKRPPDIEGEPLYDRTRGWDTLELARCWDLYTYIPKKCGTIATSPTN